MDWSSHRDWRIILRVAAEIPIIILHRQVIADQMNRRGIDDITLARWSLAQDSFSSRQMKGKWNKRGIQSRSWLGVTDNTQPCTWTYADLIGIKNYKAINNSKSINNIMTYLEWITYLYKKMITTRN